MESPLGIILFHKHPTSAKVSYLLAPESSVVFGYHIPPLTTLIDEETVLEKEEVVATHPAMILRQLTEKMGLQSENLLLIKDFRARLDVPGGIVPIYLAQFKTMDPPLAAAEAIDGKFIAITEARSLPPTELLLLRKSYQYIMEG